MELEGLYFLKT